MNKHSFPGLTKISKAAARELWGQNKTISLCPAKLRPDGPFRPNMDYFPDQQKQNEFDEVVSSFEWYNCQMNETWFYTAFYVRN